MLHPEQLRNKYPQLYDRDIFKKMYDDIFKSPAHDRADKRVWMRHFRPRPSASIIDLGCGTGGNLIWFSQTNIIDGVEISRTAHQTFQKYAAECSKDRQERMRFFNMWIEDFEIGCRYDYVLLTEVLEHVADPAAILLKARQLIKPHGLVYLTGPATIKGHHMSHVRAITQEFVEYMAPRTGFHVTWVDECPNRTYALLEVA